MVVTRLGPVAYMDLSIDRSTNWMSSAKIEDVNDVTPRNKRHA